MCRPGLSHVLAEFLTDPDNVTLFENRSDEIIVSHMRAPVTLRRDEHLSLNEKDELILPTTHH